VAVYNSLCPYTHFQPGDIHCSSFGYLFIKESINTMLDIEMEERVSKKTSAGRLQGLNLTPIGIIPGQIPECLPVRPSHSRSRVHRRQCAGEAWPDGEQARHCQGNSLPRTFSRARIDRAGVWTRCFQCRYFCLRISSGY